MRSSPKPAILAIGAAIGLVQALGAPSDPKAASAPGTPPAPTPDAKDPKKGAKPAPKSSKGKKATPVPGKQDPDDDGHQDDKITLPLPKGEPQHTVKFPLYGSDGALNYRFEMGIATLMDDDMVKMTKLRILSFKPDETDPKKRVPDMDMDLPDAYLNQRTKDLTSEAPITIKSENYEVTGKKMTFNLGTRQGTLGGGVKMVIYDMDKLNRGGKSATPTVEVDSKKIDLKK